jgi:hypothetical protein
MYESLVINFDQTKTEFKTADDLQEFIKETYPNYVSVAPDECKTERECNDYVNSFKQNCQKVIQLCIDHIDNPLLTGAVHYLIETKADVFTDDTLAKGFLNDDQIVNKLGKVVLPGLENTVSRKDQLNKKEVTKRKQSDNPIEEKLAVTEDEQIPLKRITKSNEDADVQMDASGINEQEMQIVEEKKSSENINVQMLFEEEKIQEVTQKGVPDWVKLFHDYYEYADLIHYYKRVKENDLPFGYSDIKRGMKTDHSFFKVAQTAKRRILANQMYVTKNQVM